MKTLITSFLLIITTSALAQEHPFHWLAGTWKMQNKSVYEVWKFGPDKTLSGVSFRMAKADTVVMEEIVIALRDGSYYYIPDVAGPQGSIDFKITSYTDTGFIAENPSHDFPKLIRYTIVRKEEGIFIQAAIEGNGKVIPYVFEKLR